MKFISFLKDVVTSQSGISSKRVCGLLGIDSVTGIWKKFDKKNV